MARISDDKHLVTLSYFAANNNGYDSPQQTKSESCVSLSYILNTNQLDICFQNEQEF